MHDITALDCSRIAQDLQIRKVQVEAVVQLLDEGNTVPFITRYRKERTGGLNEEVIRQVQTRIAFLRQLSSRKQTILKSIEGQGKLTEGLRQAILGADTTKRLEDLYLPYKPKKKSLATAARERGLEPLALAVWNRDPAAANLEELLPSMVNPEKELATVDDVRTGVQHILAEMMAETADVRAAVRSVLWETGKIRATKSEKLGEGQGLEYKDYFDFTEPARQIPAHRILALNRGEKENALKVHLEFAPEAVQRTALHALAENLLKREQAPKPEPAKVAEPPPAPAGEGAPVATPPPAEGQPAAEATPPAETPPAPTPPAGGEVAPLAPALPTTPVPGEPLAPGIGFNTPHALFLRRVLDDALTRLLLPSLEREIRHELTDEAETHAVAVFARNLRSLLLQPPLHHRRVLAIDPGLRTGCKLAALDDYGNLVDHTIIYPFGPHQRRGPREKKPTEKPTTPAATTIPEQTPPTPTDQAPPATSPAGENPPAQDISSGTPPEAPQPAPEMAPSAAQVTSETPPAEATGGQPAEVAASPQPQPATEPSAVAPEQPAPVQETTPAATEAPPAAETPATGETPVSTGTPAATPDRKAEAKNKLKEMITKHQIQVIALGNGTGCRETEEMIAELIATDLPELAYVIVNEAGASVYSVSAYGREEFPTFDSTLRSTISIGRRLQDPLSELVKVDPPNIGVGLYQHDINRKELHESLDGVVESCVNQVGVDLNTASVPLLRHVSGLNQLVARELVDHRQKNGPFTSREQLLQITGVGPTRYVQAAGFLKIQGPNPLDRTWIHPESYPVAEKILEELGYTPKALEDKAALEELQGKLKALQAEDVARRLNVGVPTVQDILQALARPGRDPREDLPPPIFKKGILKLEDLQAGMELKGTVLNVVDFGAFVDIGLKDSGLVHISQMANRYIKSPYDVVAVSDVVTVWVLNVDKDRHRVSLTMIKPGTERKPPEKRPAREPQRGRPPRERQPVGAPGSQEQGQGPQGRPPQGQQGQGDRGRRPPRGRPAPGGRPGPGGRRGPMPAGQPGSGGQAGANLPGSTGEAGAAPPPPKVPPPPPRKPRRETPKPKLSQEALEGKVPLRTFGELSVLFSTKKDKPEEVQPAATAEAPPTAAPQPAEEPAGEKTS
jgi:uncharacterized protein